MISRNCTPGRGAGWTRVSAAGTGRAVSKNTTGYYFADWTRLPRTGDEHAKGVSAFGGDFGLLGHDDLVSGALADFSWTPAQSAAERGVARAVLPDAGVRVAAVPEPDAWLLAGPALLALLLARRRSRREG